MFWFVSVNPELSQCLCSLQASPIEDPAAANSRAIAWNCLAEHRISRERFGSFLALLTSGGAVSGAALQDAFRVYQKSKVRAPSAPSSKPAYELPENANNRVALPAAAELCTVIDLTRIGFVYSEAKEWVIKEFARFDRSNTRAINDFLSDSLGDLANRDAFLEAVFNAMARYRKETAKQIHPTSAAGWESIAPDLERSAPKRWVEAVGVAKEDPAWVAVVRYPAPPVVFRPTLLDAGWYAHHFPSPPQAETNLGGITMDLRNDVSPPGALVSEYIHRQIDFTFRHWKNAGSLVDFTDGPVPEPGRQLADLRKRHLARLIGLDPDAATWVDGAL